MATEHIVGHESQGAFRLSPFCKSPERTSGDVDPMSVSQTDGPDDIESGRVSAEQSETRMRQALERLSGDRLGGERGASAPRPQPNPQSGFSPASNFSSSSSSSFSSAGPRRHRYVQDGEVPVVQISPSRDRRRDATGPAPMAQEPPFDHGRAALEQERSARLRAEQGLERAQATIHALETRLGHAEITQNEALEQARSHAALNTQLRSELQDTALKLKAAQVEASEAQRRQRDLETELEVSQALFVPEPPPLRARAPKPASRRAIVRQVAPPADTDEPEPVQWWLIAPAKAKPKTRRG